MRKVSSFLCWIPPRTHQGHQYRMTNPAKRDASILVGGCESSAGRRLMQYVPVRWSHKHCDCSLLPLSEQHKRGIMLTSTSWYHGAPHPPRDFICCCCWNQDMELKSKRKPVDVVLGCFIAVCLYNLCLAQRREWSFVFCEGRGDVGLDEDLWMIICGQNVCGGSFSSLKKRSSPFLCPVKLTPKKEKCIFSCFFIERPEGVRLTVFLCRMLVLWRMLKKISKLKRRKSPGIMYDQTARLTNP